MDEEVRRHYSAGVERDRLSRGAGLLERERTRVLMARHLPPPPAVVVDVGAGMGAHALWLAERGYRVHVLDPLELHVEYASWSAHERELEFASASVGDARELPLLDEGADAVLLLGPLYHLVEESERLRALGEAKRVLASGGVVMAAAVSRYASLLDGLFRNLVSDPNFLEVLDRDLKDGQHRNPSHHPDYFTTAYFHRPEDLGAELAAAGFSEVEVFGVEGPAWLMNGVAYDLMDEHRRERILDYLQRVEREPSLLGVSAHLIAVGKKV